MFKASFEHMLSPAVFCAIESCQGRSATSEYRVLPVVQVACLRPVYERRELRNRRTIQYKTANVRRFPQDACCRCSSFGGSKWGGKYLRAPDVYWTIVEKCSERLVRLSDVAEVRFGIKTGANEFFYLRPTRHANGRLRNAS